MAERHLQELLGVPAAADLDPTAILALLSGEPLRGSTFAAPQLPGDDTWFSVTAMPPVDDPNPFATVLSSTSGGLGRFTVLVQHSADAGIGLYVSGGHVLVSTRARHQLAPRCDVQVDVPSMAWRTWPCYGVIYRLQAELAVDPAPLSAEASLLERLVTIEDGWCVVLSLQAAHQVEIHDTQRRIVELGQLARNTSRSPSNRPRSGRPRRPHPIGPGSRPGCR